ncbi:MAG: DUF547 domain-containing protein [Erythrobacter sp.]
MAAPLSTGSAAVGASTAVQSASPSSAAPSPLARFAPADNRREHRIDYQHWDEALAWFVVPMGPSIRQGARRVDPRTGTRRIYGHESRFRLEGNRVAFSYLTPEMVTALGEYRADLERVGSELDLTSLPRNEQLAYWINLHNVAMIEAVAQRYPLTELAGEKALDDIDLVTIDGVALSPRDIREGIVYPNWRDPKVIYGFWRGVIGGPSIQRLAFTANNVDALLALSAEEFVNSLRGVERWGGALRVSPIYEEAAPHFFPTSDALRDHLTQYAREDVRDLVGETRQVAYQSLETDLADLSRGERDPGINELCSNAGGAVGGNPLSVSTVQCTSVATRPDRSIQRLMVERAVKLERARRAGIRTGMVIFGNGEYAEGEASPEVE